MIYKKVTNFNIARLTEQLPLRSSWQDDGSFHLICDHDRPSGYALSHFQPVQKFFMKKKRIFGIFKIWL